MVAQQSVRAAQAPAANYCPDRGDVVWVEFNPQAGHEQAGRRANRWGKVKMCCRCSQPGHHAHECKQPIYPTPQPKPEPEPPKVQPMEEYFMYGYGWNS